MKIIFECKKYYDAIYNVQLEIRNMMKWGELSDDAYEAYEAIADMIVEELNERKLKHNWSE